MNNNNDKRDTLKENLLKALEKSLGIVTTACQSVGCARNTYYEYLKTDEEFKAKVEAIAEMQLDFVESSHLKLVKEGVPASVIFHLKTKGKKRGYQENIDVTSKGDKLENNLNISVSNEITKKDIKGLEDL